MDPALDSPSAAFRRAWMILDELHREGLHYARFELYHDGSGRLMIPKEEWRNLPAAKRLGLEQWLVHQMGSARWFEMDKEIGITSCHGLRAPKY